jgi:hypothetical protein
MIGIRTLHIPKVFYEPQKSGDVETTLRAYGLAISSVSCPSPPKKQASDKSSAKQSLRVRVR